MGEYNGSSALRASVLLLAALTVACAPQVRKGPTYPLDVPADGSAGGRYMGGDTSGLPTHSSAEVRVRETAPLRYVVKKGDTLWDIANHFLLDPWQWPEIWIVNDQVRNPHLIYPGDVLTLVWVGGQAAVTFDAESMRPRVRAIALEDAIPAIPIDVIRAFLRSPRLVTMEQIRKAPYVLDFVEAHLVGGADNHVYITNLKTDDIYTYEAVRLGQKYVDPETREVLGYEAIPTGELEMRDFNARAPMAQITRSYREMRAGDHLLKPQPDNYGAFFFPHAPAYPVDARIISVYDGVTEVGQFQVVTLSKGARNGLEPGHVLDVLQADRSTRDPYTGRKVDLPDLYAGQMMVFKVDATVSYALVMRAERPIHVLDKAERPQRR